MTEIPNKLCGKPAIKPLVLNVSDHILQATIQLFCFSLHKSLHNFLVNFSNRCHLFFGGSPYVFVSKEGSIVDINNLRKRTWYPALKEAGLRRRTMYEARHTFATLMLSTGENPNWISRMMGHTSVEMLFKKYNGYIPNLTHQDGSVFMQKFYEDGHFLDTCNKKGLRAKP